MANANGVHFQPANRRKGFRNSIFVNVWMNTGKIISKYELDLCVYACVRVCVCVYMYVYLILLKACARQQSINSHVI
jgi:hypothetical protein